MLRRTQIVVVAALLLVLAIQLYRPSTTNPISDRTRDIRSVLTVEPQVASVIDRSCSDCHSNQTVWPWYSHVAPASWLVVSDVNRGRAAMNFSDWTKYSAKQQREYLEDICSEISQGEMPAVQYTLMHSEARLTTAEKAAMCRWTSGALSSVRSGMPVRD
jgi:hypothetical protein